MLHRVTIRRPSSRDFLHTYRVILDREFVGRLPPGGSLDLKVTSGHHALRISRTRMGWDKGPEIALSLDDQALEGMEFVCTPKGLPWLRSYMGPEALSLSRV